MKFLFGHLDGLMALASDENIGRVAALGILRSVVINRGKKRGEVNGSARGGLDKLDILPMPTTEQRVDR